MVVRVAQQAQKASTIQRALIATDDQRIASAAADHGIQAVMTGECTSGTDRVFQALKVLNVLNKGGPSLVVNVQGDEPLIDPADIDALVGAYREGGEGGEGSVGTLARDLPQADREDPNVVKVVTSAQGRALYFSRAPLKGAMAHVGLYAYSPAVLAQFVQLPPSRLEQLERLEQLRALENDIPIYVTHCVSERPSIGVDTPEDLAAVLEELRDRAALTSRSS